MDADILIVGAGCAGLSLAVHLLEAGASDLQILLVDRREVHVRDRTWCYWSGRDHPFQAAVRQSWHRWRIVTSEHDVERGSRSVAYRCVPADAFYDMALERIGRSPNVKLLRGVSVEAFSHIDGGVAAHTKDGQITAQHVFDSRPRSDAPTPSGEIHWLQHFVGLEVETERSVFNPSVATLMDFRVMDGDDIRFMYVLPLNERTALVEDTFFGGEVRPEGEYVESIGRYLGERYGVDGWRELHRERGAIPMSTIPPQRPASDRVTNIGVRAGLARPATGYAFLAIQRHSRRLAGFAVRAGVDRPMPRGRPYPRAAEFLDRVFLSYLAREPAAAPDMFRRMFEDVAPERMARFMFDGGSRSDRAAVMRSLPASPLVGQTLRSLGPIMRATMRRA
jgi:lycopene beta-cyclase